MDCPLRGVYVNDDLLGFDLARALDEISPERRSYALGYRFDLDRRLSVAAYRLLKEALLMEFGIAGNPRLGRGSHGKPFLLDHPNIHFNLSHCAKAAACVVAEGPVGIDVETIAPVDGEVARRVLSADELALVRESAEPEVSFARFWTQKEALVKLSGEGIDERQLPGLLTNARGVALEVSVNRAAGYALSVARWSDWRGSDPRPQH